MRSAGHQSNSLALPRLGTFTARCPASGPYELRFTADNDTATDDVTARVHGGATRHESIDPGEALTVKVSAGQPVVWRLRQDTEPDTIRARARISLAPGDAGESCSFARARTRLVTPTHAFGG
ncbi:MAG: hypothetical protein QOD53_1890 [Thermoleophilaceae bacterium]|nr:hypothetical protein [Thermoleophilaceae bacterium]